jgi:hypothetical protein
MSLTILLPPENSRLRALLDHQSRLHRQRHAKHQAQAKMRRLAPTYLATILGHLPR